MSEDEKNPDSKTARSPEASLHDALTDLERILRQKHASEDAGPGGFTETPAGQQYDIPLLNDVVMPGDEAADAAPSDYEPPTSPPGSPEYDEACRLLVSRIASEIEVIVQSRIEVALKHATDEIRQQVKNHIEIMLPEILDEISQPHRRRHD